MLFFFFLVSKKQFSKNPTKRLLTSHKPELYHMSKLIIGEGHVITG